jgi:hypothetical protein
MTTPAKYICEVNPKTCEVDHWLNMGVSRCQITSKAARGVARRAKQ